MDVVTNLISRSSSRTGFNTGSLVQVLQMFAAGGLKASIHGLLLVVPRCSTQCNIRLYLDQGNSDTVPAMLTLVSLLYNKSMVTKYGVGFLNALNSGFSFNLKLWVV